MRRFSEGEILPILKEVEEDGVTIVARRYGVARLTIYRWRDKYGDKDEELERLREENLRLKRMLAEALLELDQLGEEHDVD